jgi:outer membrane lipoprotein
MLEQKEDDMRTIASLIYLALALSIFGCAYPISQQLRAETAKNVTFKMVLNNPSAYIGDIVIWGGAIIKTVNLKKGTQIFVLDTPLNYWGEPKQSIHSEGRFIAETSEFLDPEVYKRGNQVTLAGKVSGAKTLPLGKASYTYPVITIKELHLYEKQRYYPYYYYDDWGGPWWGGPYYGPDFYGFYGDGNEHEEHEEHEGPGEEREEHEGGHHGN